MPESKKNHDWTRINANKSRRLDWVGWNLIAGECDGDGLAGLGRGEGLVPALVPVTPAVVGAFERVLEGEAGFGGLVVGVDLGDFNSQTGELNGFVETHGVFRAAEDVVEDQRGKTVLGMNDEGVVIGAGDCDGKEAGTEYTEMLGGGPAVQLAGNLEIGGQQAVRWVNDDQVLLGDGRIVGFDVGHFLEKGGRAHGRGGADDQDERRRDAVSEDEEPGEKAAAESLGKGAACGLNVVWQAGQEQGYQGQGANGGEQQHAVAGERGGQGDDGQEGAGSPETGGSVGFDQIEKGGGHQQAADDRSGDMKWIGRAEDKDQVG